MSSQNDYAAVGLVHSQRPRGSMADDRQHVLYVRQLLGLEEQALLHQLATVRPCSLQLLCIETLCKYYSRTGRIGLHTLDRLPATLACIIGDGCLASMEPFKERMEAVVVEQLNRLRAKDPSAFNRTQNRIGKSRPVSEDLSAVSDNTHATHVKKSQAKSSRDGAEVNEGRYLKDGETCKVSFRPFTANQLHINIDHLLTSYSCFMYSLYSRHTQIAWVRCGFSLSFYRSQARALMLRSPGLQEIHLWSTLGLAETVMFLDEYTHEYQPNLLALCGWPNYPKIGGVLKKCTNLRKLEAIIADPRQIGLDFHSTSLTHLSVHLDISLSLNEISSKFPCLKFLSLKTITRNREFHKPRLYNIFKGGENASTTLPNLTNLEISGFFVCNAFTFVLPKLESLTLRKCLCSLDHLCHQPALTTLNLKLVKHVSPTAFENLLFPRMRSLDLHSQWGQSGHINLDLINSAFPALQSLKLRNDFYRIAGHDWKESAATPTAALASADAGDHRWFPKLSQLSLNTSAERYSDGVATVFTAVFPALRTVFLKRCVPHTDLLARFCPQLVNLDLFSVAPPIISTQLPLVRRAIFRHMRIDVIGYLCELLPALEQAEVRVDCVTDQISDACKALARRLETSHSLRLVIIEVL